MANPIKKEFSHNILRQPKKILGEIGEAEIKQMLDDIEYYQNRVEELEKTHMTKKPKLKVIDVKMNGDTLDVYVDTNEEGRRLLMESAINQSFANLCNDNIHKLSWWKRFKYAWKNAK